MPSMRSCLHADDVQLVLVADAGAVRHLERGAHGALTAWSRSGCAPQVFSHMHMRARRHCVVQHFFDQAHHDACSAPTCRRQQQVHRATAPTMRGRIWEAPPPPTQPRVNLGCTELRAAPGDAHVGRGGDSSRAKHPAMQQRDDRLRMSRTTAAYSIRLRNSQTPRSSPAHSGRCRPRTRARRCRGSARRARRRANRLPCNCRKLRASRRDCVVLAGASSTIVAIRASTSA